MDINIDNDGLIPVIVLRSENLDSGNADEFRRHIAPILATNPQVILDMNHVEFLDSTGLGAILSCLRRAGETGGDMKLIGVSENVRSVFRITRMHRIFDIFESKEEAMLSFCHAFPE